MDSNLEFIPGLRKKIWPSTWSIDLEIVFEVRSVCHTVSFIEILVRYAEFS